MNENILVYLIGGVVVVWVFSSILKAFFNMLSGLISIVITVAIIAVIGIIFAKELNLTTQHFTDFKSSVSQKIESAKQHLPEVIVEKTVEIGDNSDMNQENINDMIEGDGAVNSVHSVQSNEPFIRFNSQNIADRVGKIENGNVYDIENKLLVKKEIDSFLVCYRQFIYTAPIIFINDSRHNLNAPSFYVSGLLSNSETVCGIEWSVIND